MTIIIDVRLLFSADVREISLDESDTSLTSQLSLYASSIYLTSHTIPTMEGALTNLFISSDIILNKQAELLNLQKKVLTQLSTLCLLTDENSNSSKDGEMNLMTESDFEEK